MSNETVEHTNGGCFTDIRKYIQRYSNVAKKSVLPHAYSRNLQNKILRNLVAG
jgi:hypothetical protein